MAKILGCLGVIVLVIGVLAFFLAGEYNGLVSGQQSVEAQWAQVENVYQRRADLVPNLVSTVKGAANFEQETLNQVVQARSRVGQVSAQATQSMIDNPAQFAKFEAAQDQLSSALSRLLVVVERYPELRSVAAFQDLMTQLEGTENRIAVERRRFNEVARDFNTRLKRVPTRWFIDLLHWDFKEKAYFQAQPGAEQAPEVNFEFGEQGERRRSSATNGSGRGGVDGLDERSGILDRRHRQNPMTEIDDVGARGRAHQAFRFFTDRVQRTEQEGRIQIALQTVFGPDAFADLRHRDPPVHGQHLHG